VIDIFWFGSDTCAFEVVPARPSALALIFALNPEGVRDALAAYALVFLLHLVLLDLFLRFLRPLHRLLLLPLVFIDPFSRVLLLEVVENNPFEVEGVEESALGEGGDVFRVDRPDLVCVISSLDHLAVFGNLCDFGVGTGDDLIQWRGTYRNSS
jgi:hypothetical protein